MSTKSIAIITARGGSKRIPHKNLREFCGRPIIAYAIEAALECGRFDEIMVSTDDMEIAKLAKQFGAEVPFMRSEKTANDYATTVDVLLEVLSEYKRIGKLFEKGCCIYPTAVFVTAEKLRTAMELLETEPVDTVMPVVAYSFPPQRAVVVRDGRVKLQHPEFFNCRSQDLEKIYHDCGQFYAFDVAAFIKNGILLGDRVLPLVMNDLEVQDIDTMDDWKLAELKYKLMLDTGKDIIK